VSDEPDPGAWMGAERLTGSQEARLLPHVAPLGRMPLLPTLLPNRDLGGYPHWV
jgi:hypothetical protein